VSKLRVLDLFSGIGGFSLGLERTGGFKTVAFCEIEPNRRRDLARLFPNVTCHHDIRTLRGEAVGPVDVICGGFPCQDISNAGDRAGLAGQRSGLWSQYARLVGELRPRLVLVENVSALLDLGLGTVLGDLAALGYDAEWHCIPASAVGAPHPRDRVWIVAYPQGEPRLHECFVGLSVRRALPDHCANRRSAAWGPAAPILCRVDDAVPGRVDISASLGNAVVPDIPELIGNAILASLAEREVAHAG
jgi:DNA (cytosine-5)-methyltransferase 1